MARPTTKDDLLEASRQTFEQLITTLDTLSDAEKNGHFHFDLTKKKEAHWKRDQNIRDVLIHLYEWQALLLKWVKNNQEGKKTDFLPEGYNWSNYGDMNLDFWKQHQRTTYQEALKLLEDSHQEVMALIESFSNQELFTKGVFPWTGSNTLGAYFVSNTSSHYNWALKKIRMYIRSLKH